MKNVTAKSPEQIARRKLQLTTEAKQAARRAELLRDNARRVKAEMKAARKVYKQTRKSARKAEKQAARLADELKAFLKTAAKHARKAAKAAAAKPKPRRRIATKIETTKMDAPSPAVLPDAAA